MQLWKKNRKGEQKTNLSDLNQPLTTITATTTCCLIWLPSRVVEDTNTETHNKHYNPRPKQIPQTDKQTDRHSHNGVDPSTVAFPHGSEARLSPDVPHLDGHVALGDLAHVEAHRGDHVLAELS
ncbi:hypothetical protein E2C01_031188 [Portunus trituberculatus]|uniref:Uncharacterized protein n=1 Tax=Portunus trituberculatus TaxID=210409 RepID=A0A5B7EXG0_PORTR|nr:hypothetical protein [Portunus trituberculatus]